MRKSAFTLLELIVVIAITAILLVALLPGIATLRGRSQSTSCQSNLHALATAFVQYSLEYPDRFPFGFVFNRQNANGRPASGENPINYITWFSSLDKYLTPGTNALIPLNFNTGIIDGATTRKFNLVFKCPSVPVNFQQQVHYYQHGVVMPVMPLELGLTPSGRVKITGPAKVNQVYPNTALVWDTPLYAYAAPQAPSMYWISQHSVAGYNLPCTFIDDNAPAFSTENGLLCHPEFPERRFRGPGADRFATSSNALKNPAGPIAWPSDAFIQSLGIEGLNTLNMDVILDPGIARFRHTGGGCNVLFADGSVQTLFLHPHHKVSFGVNGAANFIDSDFKRYMLMIKWPNNGIHDSNTYPTE